MITPSFILIVVSKFWSFIIILVQNYNSGLAPRRWRRGGRRRPGAPRRGRRRARPPFISIYIYYYYNNYKSGATSQYKRPPASQSRTLSPYTLYYYHYYDYGNIALPPASRRIYYCNIYACYILLCKNMVNKNMVLRLALRRCVHGPPAVSAPGCRPVPPGRGLGFCTDLQNLFYPVFYWKLRTGVTKTGLQ